MDLGIKGRKAIVCAASKGLGRACAFSLAREGVDVVITARTADVLERTAEELRKATGVRVTAVAGDITTEAGRKAALEACPEPDILVNNAGGPPPGDFREWDRDTWIRALDGNMLTPIFLIRAVVDGMIARRFGRIVLVVSDTVWDPPAGDLLAYVASKAALIGIARTLARTLGRKGITVNCVAPGLTPTPAAIAGTPPEAFAAVRTRQAIGRDLVPDDIAAAVTFLVSDAAGAVTGQTLCADGGLVLR